MCNREDFIDYPDYDEDSLDSTFEDLIYDMEESGETGAWPPVCPRRNRK